ncbi:MAG: hypothetical protein CMK07_07740 [Ponticaulis sp.]|nr:hypothetical protein [Ponticaulis sp.]
MHAELPLREEANKCDLHAEAKVSGTSSLRLMAVNKDDLSVLSAACQDGVCKPSDLVYEGRQRRFRIEFNRFRWEAGAESQKGANQRVRSVLSFEDVTGVKVRGLPAKPSDVVLSVLSLDWVDDDEPPGGEVRILFAGDGELVIAADCLDATLLDISEPWKTRNRPEHEDRG